MSAEVLIFTVRLGALKEYPMLYDFNENYLTDKNGLPLLRFTSVGGSPSQKWGWGVQATLASESNPLPSGIKVRWFSVAENQFWEGTYQFNQQLLNNLTNYTVNNIIFRTTRPFTDSFMIIVNTVPGGLVTVWILSEGEQFLLAQFKAEKVDEQDWNSFSDNVLQLKEIIPRESYIERTLNKPELAETKKEISENALPNEKAWLRLMNTYSWSLALNEDFVLKDYLAWYLNGEQIFTYESDTHRIKHRAVPFYFALYFKDRSGGELHRIDLTINKEEVMEGFEKMVKTPPLGKPIEFYLDISPDLKSLRIYLRKNDIKLELFKVKAEYPELYN